MCCPNVSVRDRFKIMEIREYQMLQTLKYNLGGEDFHTPSPFFFLSSRGGELPASSACLMLFTS